MSHKSKFLHSHYVMDKLWAQSLFPFPCVFLGSEVTKIFGEIHDGFLRTLFATKMVFPLPTHAHFHGFSQTCPLAEKHNGAHQERVEGKAFSVL